MAIFHLSAKAIQRSAGRSAAASAAYRSGQKIPDPRQGKVWEYRARSERIQHVELLLPDGVKPMTRQELWSKVETHHKRGDAVTAREVEVALPHELPEPDRVKLAVALGKAIVKAYGVACDVSVHKSSGHGENWHAHILIPACSVGPDGLGKKVAELDPVHCQRSKVKNPVERMRPYWEKVINKELELVGSVERVDHRTLKEQGIDREPTEHEGRGSGSNYRKERNRKRKEIEALEMELKAELEREAMEQKEITLTEREFNALVDHAESIALRIGKKITRPEPGEVSVKEVAEFIAVSEHEENRQHNYPIPEPENWPPMDDQEMKERTASIIDTAKRMTAAYQEMEREQGRQKPQERTDRPQTPRGYDGGR